MSGVVVREDHVYVYTICAMGQLDALREAPLLLCPGSVL